MKNVLFFFLVFFYTNQSWSMFQNPGFETVTCPTDCSTASSNMDCVEDWWLVYDVPGSAPLMKAVCNETVCSGEYSILLTGSSGGGNISIETNNPFWGLPTPLTPSAILLDANILPISDSGTGIRILGSNGTGSTLLGFYAPDIVDQCLDIVIPVTPSISSFQFLQISVGMETGHIDSHQAVVDNFDICEELFLIEEECGEITVSVNCDLDITNTILEVFGQMNSLLWEELPHTFTLAENGEYLFNIFYTINGVTKLVKFDYTVTTALEICCDESLICSEETDLTACADEGNFGYIHLSCDAQTSISFDWSFPSGSTASEFSCDNHSILTELSEGNYSVTITDETGCEEVREYKVIQDCCKPTCPTPTNPGCYDQGTKMLLTWDAVPNVIGYEVWIVLDDPACCGKPIGQSLAPKFTTATNLVLNSIMNECFSWRVRAVCAEDFRSPYTAKQCYYNRECYKPLNVQIGVGTGIHDVKTKVLPNPTNGPVTFYVEAPSAFDLGLNILTSDGKLAYSVDEKEYADGIFKMEWDVSGTLKDGIYYCLFITNLGTFQEKLVVYGSSEE